MPEPQDGAKPPGFKRTCGAQTRTTEHGGGCRKPIKKTQKRCKIHGGGAPRARAKEHERELEQAANAAIQGMDIKPVDNPLVALSQVAGEILAWKDLMATHVAKLNDKLRYEGEAAEQIRGEVTLYERAMDRAVQVLAAIGRLKIDERLAAITDAQVRQMGIILEGALSALGLDYEQKRTAFAEMSRLARKADMGRLPAAG